MSYKPDPARALSAQQLDQMGKKLSDRCQRILDDGVEPPAGVIDEIKRDYEIFQRRSRDLVAKKELENMMTSARGPLTGADGGSFGTFGGAVRAAGFDLKTNPSVEIPTASILAKTVTGPASNTWNTVDGGLVEMGRDARYLAQVLQSQNADGASAVSDFKQTARSVTGSVSRAIDATTQKSELGVTVVHELVALQQFAILASSIPNALLEDMAQLSDFLQAEMRFQVFSALDAHIVAQIIAATPPTFSTGANDIEKLRYAIADMEERGMSPNVLACSTDFAASLDLATSGSSTPYLFPPRTPGGASPLFGLRIVPTPAMSIHNAMLLDTSKIGVLYAGRTRFDVDPYSEFGKNLSTLRLEVQALFHVRNANAAAFEGTVS